MWKKCRKDGNTEIVIDTLNVKKKKKIEANYREKQMKMSIEIIPYKNRAISADL